MIELEIVSGVAQGQRLLTQAPFISLGRAPERSLIIDDPFVSRHHGEIVLLDVGYQYRDLNSTHGTLLRRDGDEQLVRQVELRVGDELGVGGTANLIRVSKLVLDNLDLHDSSITRLHTRTDDIVAPEERHAEDSHALRSMVAFDSAITRSQVTNERQLYRSLLKYLAEMFNRLQFAAVVTWEDGTAQPFDFEQVDPTARVRLSSNVIEMVNQHGRGMVYEVRDISKLVAGAREVELSEVSQVTPLNSRIRVQTGICLPIPHTANPAKYLLLERDEDDGKLVPRDLDLVESMVIRVSDRLNTLRLIEQNQRLRNTASLGIFSSMIGHDIKNYLFYSKPLSEIQDDPLSAHRGVSKGIERARKLAQSMKDLGGPGRVTLATFSATRMAENIAGEFQSLFGEVCQFEAVADPGVPDVTTHEDLLSRVVWNLVMNAYHAMDNRPRGLSGEPTVRIRIKPDTRDRVSIGIIDNAGGIGGQTMQYIERLFAMVERMYVENEDMMDVVDAISRMSGFTNSIGLFFTATAVHDMHGSIRVETKRGEGSVVIVKIPRQIDALRSLLTY